MKNLSRCLNFFLGRAVDRKGAMASVLLAICFSIVSPATAQVPVQTVRGRVILDANANGRLDPGEKGIEGIAISDGVQFVKTKEDGSYELRVADDPMFPYKPAQVIAMSWPSGTWPSSQWYRRLADLREDDLLNFSLRPDLQQFPFILAHGTDPHDTCAGEKSRMWAAEIRRMKRHVSFAVMTGDLGYAGVDNAHQMFSSIAAYTQKFPVPLFHTIGNHDVVGIHKTDWNEQSEIHGNGAYTKYLGPVRWSFDYAGIHFVGLDWALIDPKDGSIQLGVPEVATNWLRQDFARQEPGTRTFLFMHSQWSPTSAFWDTLVENKLELLLAGHSHRNLDVSYRGITALTTMNLRGPYRLLTVHQNGYEIIDRCMGCKDPTYHSRQCRLKTVELNTAPRRQQHLQLAEVQLDSRQRPLDHLQANGVELLARIEPAGAKRCGVKFVSANNTKDAIELACSGQSLVVDGLEIPAVPLPGDSHFDLRILVDADRLAIASNLRVVYEKPLERKAPVRAILFAEQGKAVFKNVEAWGLK